MGDTQYSLSEVTIKDKNEECIEKVLKAIKEQGNDIKSSNSNNTINIIDDIRLKHESIMNALQLIFVMLIISMIINIFLLLVLCHSLGIFG